MGKLDGLNSGPTGRIMETLFDILERPHNYTLSHEQFMTLLTICYHKDKKGLSLDEFCDYCLFSYGGTLADALVDFLNNQ
jgi:hypothetical protein